MAEEMQNVSIKVEGNKAIITIEIDKEFGPSSTGKTIIVASTRGTVAIPNTNVRLGLNAFKKV